MAPSKSQCHLDSHQIAAGSAPGMGTLYDFESIAGHFTFDLGPELPILQCHLVSDTKLVCHRRETWVGRP
jgi:hypothetical protein